MEEQLSTIFSAFRGTANEVIPLLQKTQEEMGFLPEEAMRRIAEFAGIPFSKVYGVATFYTMFRFTPLGKNHVCVCRGTACHVRGADQILEHVERELGITENETTEDGDFSLETVACIGCCALAPCITVNSDVHGRLTPRKASRVLKKVRSASEKEEAHGE
jgi:NADH-quinone oxidoreductase subunit E